MKKITNLKEANKVLADYISPVGNKAPYTLDRILILMEFLGNPQDRLNVIHIAGTSGKTSTSYYVAALLSTTGKKVGLSVSPHVTDVRERVQINTDTLPETEFCAELDSFITLIKDCPAKPTYFELLIAFAFWEFERQGVDYAVIEVGIGGLLDGTNVIKQTGKICVITDIGYDHINVLGKTLPAIAAQKAGIIHNGNAVFSYQQDRAITKVIKDRCAEQSADLHIIQPQNISTDFAFLPLFQRHNFGLAHKVVSYILRRDNMPALTLEQQLAGAHTLIPARMEIFNLKDKTVILDGAHNYQKLHALIDSIKAQFTHQSIAVLVGFVGGSEFRLADNVREILSIAESVIVTSFESSQDWQHKSVEPGEVVQLFRKEDFHNIVIVDKPSQALSVLLKQPEPLLLVAGSFYLLNDIRPLILKL